MPIHAVIPLLHEVGEIAFHVLIVQTAFDLSFIWGKSRICFLISVNELTLILKFYSTIII